MILDTYQGTTSVVDALDERRHAGLTLPNQDDLYSQKRVIQDVARGLAKRKLIAIESVVIVRAPGVLQAPYKDEQGNPYFVQRQLERTQRASGRRALIGVIGLDRSRGYENGDPAVLQSLADLMTDPDGPFTFQVGNEHGSGLRLHGNAAPTPAEEILSTLPSQFTLSMGSRWGSVIVEEMESGLSRLTEPTGRYRVEEAPIAALV